MGEEEVSKVEGISSEKNREEEVIRGSESKCLNEKQDAEKKRTVDEEESVDQSLPKKLKGVQGSVRCDNSEGSSREEDLKSHESEDVIVDKVMTDNVAFDVNKCSDSLRPPHT